jgi:quercetin dioxygenase-like cupin family protein
MHRTQGADVKRFNLDESSPAPAGEAHFDGQVMRRDLIHVDDPPSGAIVVEFGAGGRTHWHSHPDGQYIYVLAGEGRIQSRGQEIEPLRAGDCIYAAPGEEHWHGAGTDSSVTHLAFSHGPTQWLGSADE